MEVNHKPDQLSVKLLFSLIPKAAVHRQNEKLGKAPAISCDEQHSRAQCESRDFKNML